MKTDADKRGNSELSKKIDILIQAYNALETVYKQEVTLQATKDVMITKINANIEVNKALQRVNKQQIGAEEWDAAARARAVGERAAYAVMASPAVKVAVKDVEDAAFFVEEAAAKAENAYYDSDMEAGGAKRTARRGKQVNFNPYAGKTNTKKYRRRNKRKTKHYKKKAKRYTKKHNMRY